MSKKVFERAIHRQVEAILSQLDREFLAQSQCYFGGGTRIVLELGEYRESKDIDFLCANRDGYRALRETITDKSLEDITVSDITLAREVRADQYGIRTFIESKGTRLKFEIIREARIDISGEEFTGIPVLCLSHKHCFAEKFLANADRGLDTSTLSRDLIDLAFMIENWSVEDAGAGLKIAEQAYGNSIRRSLNAVIVRMREDKTYRKQCIDNLGITAPTVISKGIKALEQLINT